MMLTPTQESFPHVDNTDHRDFIVELERCSSSQVLKLLNSMNSRTYSIAPLSLIKLADLKGNGKEPKSYFEDGIFKDLCSQSEKASGYQNNDSVVVLLGACVKLGIDPLSSLMFTLISECQDRLLKGEVGRVSTLCAVGNRFQTGREKFNYGYTDFGVAGCKS